MWQDRTAFVTADSGCSIAAIIHDGGCLASGSMSVGSMQPPAAVADLTAFIRSSGSQRGEAVAPLRWHYGSSGGAAVGEVAPISGIVADGRGVGSSVGLGIGVGATVGVSVGRRSGGP